MDIILNIREFGFLLHFTTYKKLGLAHPIRIVYFDPIFSVIFLTKNEKESFNQKC